MDLKKLRVKGENVGRKIRVIAKRRKKTWVIHRNGKRIIAHARKKVWVYERKDVGKPGKGKKVIKIKRPGLINSIALRKYGKTFTELNKKQMKEVLMELKRKGYTEKQMLGMMQAQVVFRKRTQKDVRKKFEIAREIVAKEIFPP